MIVANKSQTKNGIFDVSSSNQVQSRGLKFDALRRVRDVRKCWRGRNMTLIHKSEGSCIGAGIHLIAKGT